MRGRACVPPECPTAGGMQTLGSEAEGDAPVQRRAEEEREGEAECVWQEQERCRAGARDERHGRGGCTEAGCR